MIKLLSRKFTSMGGIQTAVVGSSARPRPLSENARLTSCCILLRRENGFTKASSGSESRDATPEDSCRRVNPVSARCCLVLNELLWVDINDLQGLLLILGLLTRLSG